MDEQAICIITEDVWTGVCLDRLLPPDKEAAMERINGLAKKEDQKGTYYFDGSHDELRIWFSKHLSDSSRMDIRPLRFLQSHPRPS